MLIYSFFQKFHKKCNLEKSEIIEKIKKIIRKNNYARDLTPKFLHKFFGVNTEFGGVDFGELFEGEGPTVETGSETNGSVSRVNADGT